MRQLCRRCLHDTAHYATHGLTMITIILSTCLLADPAVCHDETIPLSNEVSSAVRCVMMAPPHVAKWSEEHPQWRVVRWQCRVSGRRDI
jgi:hypothetical protein